MFRKILDKYRFQFYIQTMKMFIIGHQVRLSQVLSVVKKYYPEIEAEELEYNNSKQTSDIIRILKDKQKSIDAVLFTGSIPFKLVNNNMIPIIPCDFLRKDESSILQALLKIVIIHKHGLNCLSFDTYSRELIENVYNGLGRSWENSTYYFSDEQVEDGLYIESVFNFHKSLYITKKVSYCITALSNVYELLVADNIPSLKLDPSDEIVKQTVERLVLKYTAKKNAENSLVVMAIDVSLPNEFSLVNENEYQLVMDRMQITKKIYLYAQRLQAAVVQENQTQYLLFSTRKAMEIETRGYQHIDLLNEISSKSVSKISIGVGYGFSAREAKYCANRGMQKARKQNENSAYVVSEGIVVAGPILQSVVKSTDDISSDNNLSIIAEESELSINTVFKIKLAIDTKGTNVFTSKELASDLNISLRSMNKIIKKLENCKRIEIVGKKVVSTAGRPSRIFKLFFD